MLGGYPDCHQKYDLRKTEIDHELECQVVRDVPPLPPLHQASLSGFLQCLKIINVADNVMIAYYFIGNVVTVYNIH